MKVWQKDFALYPYTPGNCAGAVYTYSTVNGAGTNTRSIYIQSEREISLAATRET